MKSLVRKSNNSRAVGEQSEVYLSRLDKVQVGELIEITNQDLQTLNIAKVIEVKQQSTVVIEMVA